MVTEPVFMVAAGIQFRMGSSMHIAYTQTLIYKAAKCGVSLVISNCASISKKLNVCEFLCTVRATPSQCVLESVCVREKEREKARYPAERSSLFQKVFYAHAL